MKACFIRDGDGDCVNTLDALELSIELNKLNEASQALGEANFEASVQQGYFAA